MTRSEANTFLEDAGRNERFLARSWVRTERRSCLVCGARIGSADVAIEIRGALVHIRCAVHRRRLVRR